jgi:hypothetical protein
MPDEMEDLCIGLALLEGKSRRNPQKETSFQEAIRTLLDNFVVSLDEVDSREEFIKRMQCCNDTLQSLVHQLKALNTSDSYFKTKTRRSLSKDVAEMQRQIALVLTNA